MDEDRKVTERNTSAYFQFYQGMFEMADITSCFWQPTLKAMGRAQLEFAGMQAKQTRAFVHFAYQWMRPTTPEQFFSASVQLWSTIIEEASAATPRIAAVVEAAAEAASPPKVLQMPPKPARDTLILLDRDEVSAAARRVA